MRLMLVKMNNFMLAYVFVLNLSYALWFYCIQASLN